MKRKAKDSDQMKVDLAVGKLKLALPIAKTPDAITLLTNAGLKPCRRTPADRRSGRPGLDHGWRGYEQTPLHPKITGRK